MSGTIRLMRSAASADWRRHEAAAAGVYLALYVVFDWLSYVQPVLKLGITPWNPQAGLTLAFLLICGPRWAFVTAAAVLLSEVLVRQISISLLAIGVAIWISLGYGALAALLRKWNLATAIQTLSAGARLAIASVGATLVIAAGYVLLFAAAGELPWAQALNSLPRLWIGDLTGILTLTPLLISAGEWRDAIKLVRSRPVEVIAQFAALLITLWIIFGLPATDQLRFFYPLFVPVIWIALRWGLVGATIAALTIQIGLIVAAQGESSVPPLIDLQFLMLTLSLTALLLGAVITERRRTEAQLRERDTALARAMRFAVAGELASALAHELNQPITALVSYLRAAEILGEPFGRQEARLTTTLSKAAQEAIRASEVLRRLRDFYRGGARNLEDVHVPELCAAVAQSFNDRLRRTGVLFVTRIDPSLPSLKADSLQLEVVLHNLLSNALDAVVQVGRQWRRIELHAQRANDAIVIRVEDSGPGLAPELAQKLFEPFMTSKSDGMGLGLAISRSFVRARGGDLVFEQSEKLRGACFIVRLPIAHPVDEMS